MKWQVEYIADVSYVNILENKEDVHRDDQEPIGMGLPLDLAERIVQMHNAAIDQTIENSIATAG